MIYWPDGIMVTGPGNTPFSILAQRLKRERDGPSRYILAECSRCMTSTFDQLGLWKECVNVGTLISGEAQIELLERGKEKVA